MAMMSACKKIIKYSSSPQKEKNKKKSEQIKAEAGPKSKNKGSHH